MCWAFPRLPAPLPRLVDQFSQSIAGGPPHSAGPGVAAAEAATQALLSSLSRRLEVAGIVRTDLSGKEIPLWRTAPRVVSVVLIPGIGSIQVIENSLDDIRIFNA